MRKFKGNKLLCLVLVILIFSGCTASDIPEQYAQEVYDDNYSIFFELTVIPAPEDRRENVHGELFLNVEGRATARFVQIMSEDRALEEAVNDELYRSLVA